LGSKDGPRFVWKNGSCPPHSSRLVPTRDRCVLGTRPSLGGPLPIPDLLRVFDIPLIRGTGVFFGIPHLPNFVWKGPASCQPTNRPRFPGRAQGTAEWDYPAVGPLVGRKQKPLRSSPVFWVQAYPISGFSPDPKIGESSILSVFYPARAAAWKTAMRFGFPGPNYRIPT